MKVYDQQGKEFHLFPLEKYKPRFRGYYMSADGKVYSTRGGNNLKELTGSKANTWANRYFTLDGGSWEQNHLVTSAKAHKDFVLETTVPTVVGVKTALVPQKLTTERNHAKTAEDALAAKGSIIASVIKGKFAFGSDPVIHTTRESLKSEMARLANQNPGVRYVAFTITSSVVAGGMSWS